MKREDLFEAIGDVDDLLLEENVAPAGRRSWLPFLVTAAACVGVAVGAAALLPTGRQLETEPGNSTLETAVMMTEPYFMGLPGDETNTEASTEATVLADQSTDSTDEAATEESAVTEAATDSGKEAEIPDVSPPPTDTEDTNSFRYVLTQIYEKQSYMYLSFNTYTAFDINANRFAIYDLDGDGADELLFLWEETNMASMVGVVFGHDANGNVSIEFCGNPFLHVYSNGLIKHDDSHNQGLSGRFWPYTLCRYVASTDTYEIEYSVYAWDSEMMFLSPDLEYPAEADVSGSGIVYFVGERGPLDITEFEAWEQETFGDAYELDLPFRDFTKENIAAVQQ